MTESRAEAIYETFLKDIPVNERSHFRSLAVSMLGTAYEAEHNLDAAIKVWAINNDILRQIIDENPEKALEFAVDLITLPEKQEKEKYEYFRQFLVGNGLTILADDKLKGLVTPYLKENEKGPTLVDKIGEAQSLDVSGWDENRALSTPQSFNLLASLAVGVKLGSGPLAEQAQARRKDPSVKQLIDFFRPIEDVQPIIDILNS